jgi:hypothetical protein
MRGIELGRRGGSILNEMRPDEGETRGIRSAVLHEGGLSGVLEGGPGGTRADVGQRRRK